MDLTPRKKKGGFVYFGWISNERVPSSWIGSGLVVEKERCVKKAADEQTTNSETTINGAILDVPDDPVWWFCSWNLVIGLPHISGTL